MEYNRMGKKKKYNLKDLLVNIVSLVDYPANQRMFLLQKSIDGGEMKSKLDEMVKNGSITQEDADLIVKNAEKDKDENGESQSAKDAIEAIEKANAEKAEAEKAAIEKAEAEKVAKEKADAEKAAKDAEDKAAVEKAAAEKAEIEKAEAEKKAKEDSEKVALEKAEAEKSELAKSVAELTAQVAELKKALDLKTEAELDKDEIKKYEELTPSERRAVLLAEMHKKKDS